MRSDEAMVLRMDMLTEFPEGVPSWMVSLPAEEVREHMRNRREGFTSLGFDPADDAPDKFDLH